MKKFLALGTMLFALVISSCQLTLSPVGGSSSSACPVGNWQLSSETINAAVTKLGSSLASNLQVTLSGTGMTVSINADGTWILTANQSGTFIGNVMGSIPVKGDGVIKASASGTYTKTATTLEFKLTSLTGSIDVNASINGGAPQAFSFPLSKLNAEDHEDEMDDAVALSGSANYSCGSNGTLALTFTSTHIDMHFHH